MTQTLLAEEAAHLTAADVTADPDATIRIIVALCQQIETLEAAQASLAGEYTAYLNPEYDQMLRSLHANGRLTDSSDLEDAFQELVEFSLDCEWQAWKHDQSAPTVAMNTALSA